MTDRVSRKKSKCPGEQPQCSICKRLGQSCAYDFLGSEGQKRKRAGQFARDDLQEGEVRGHDSYHVNVGLNVERFRSGLEL